MELGIELSEIVERLETQQRYVQSQLLDCPEGSLRYSKSDIAKGTLIQEIRRDGVRHRHRLANDPDLVRALLRKCALQDENAALTHNIELINSLRNEIFDYSATEEMAKLINKYSGIDRNLLRHIFDEKPSSWALEEYEKSNYRPEERRHITSYGLRVRSKSEVLIGETLHKYNLEQRYEQVIQIGNVTLIPDFMIRRKDGKIFIWEHEGLTNVKSYLDWQMKKAELYAGIGYVPWENLIITYDGPNGVIDLRIVESEIKNKLLL